MDIFDTIFENDEMWYFYAPSNAILINDGQLFDY